jgi:tetratricopeptide (TPR) repeat protein
MKALASTKSVCAHPLAFTTRKFRLGVCLCVAALALGTGGCGAKKKITDLQRKEAAHMASEAEFAITVRDWPRAEGLLAKAVQVCPDTGQYWLSLGTARIRAGNKNGAKEAYQGALRAFEGEADANKNDPEPWLRQAYVLGLLGRIDDGRALLDKALKKFPADRTVRSFVENKQFDKLIAQPDFKQIAL